MEREAKTKYSWQANKLLKIKDLTSNWIRLKVRDGKSCLFWIDNWSPYGNLISFLNPSGYIHLGIAHGTTLNTLWTNNPWRIPLARSDAQLQLQIHLTTVSLTPLSDYYEWWPDRNKATSYATGTIYKLLKNIGDLVPWSKVIWFFGGIPKHKFLAWLFTLNRCPTRDRIMDWGLQTNPSCLLCVAENESRDHMFFDWTYAWSIWEVIARKVNLPPQRRWEDSLIALQSLIGSKALQLLAWQATINCLWTERNLRLHRNDFKSADSIISTINDMIKNMVSSPIFASTMMQLWFQGALAVSSS